MSHVCTLVTSLEFGKAPPTEKGGPEVFTSEILAMVSPEREKVPLQKVHILMYRRVLCVITAALL